MLHPDFSWNTGAGNQSFIVIHELFELGFCALWGQQTSAELQSWILFCNHVLFSLSSPCFFFFSTIIKYPSLDILCRDSTSFACRWDHLLCKSVSSLINSWFLLFIQGTLVTQLFSTLLPPSKYEIELFITSSVYCTIWCTSLLFSL